MNSTRKSTYLESRIMTASQPQLHLMLIEGALRFGHLARQFWKADPNADEACQPLDRMIDVVEELVYSTAGKTGVSKQLEEQYAFVFRELAVCRVERNLEKLEAALQLLDHQRETWKMACERLESQPVAQATVPMPHLPITESGSLSLEA